MTMPFPFIVARDSVTPWLAPRTGNTSIRLPNLFACTPCSSLNCLGWDDTCFCELDYHGPYFMFIFSWIFFWRNMSFFPIKFPGTNSCCFGGEVRSNPPSFCGFPARSSGSGDARFISVYKNPPAGCGEWFTQSRCWKMLLLKCVETARTTEFCDLGSF